jgi:uncharacterized damage-inducible protein DinB
VNMLARLIDQMFDANRAMIEYLRSLEVPSSELMRLASHILQAEEVWLCRIQGRQSPPNAFTPVPLERMAADNEANYAGYKALLQATDGDKQSSDDTAFTRRIAYKTFDGAAGDGSMADIILHVITHGYHHRGQMAAFCSQKQMKPFANTAYIVYTRRLGL